LHAEKEKTYDAFTREIFSLYYTYKDIQVYHLPAIFGWLEKYFQNSFSIFKHSFHEYWKFESNIGYAFLLQGWVQYAVGRPSPCWGGLNIPLANLPLAGMDSIYRWQRFPLWGRGQYTVGSASPCEGGGNMLLAAFPLAGAGGNMPLAALPLARVGAICCWQTFPLTGMGAIQRRQIFPAWRMSEFIFTKQK
jgi:hypothetical protein